MKFEHWLNNKYNLIWVFSILIGCLFILYIGSYSLLKNFCWIRDAIGFIGGIASLLGILFALLQINNTKTEVDHVKVISEATKKAAEETRASIKKTFSIVHITKYCEQIRWAQEYISKNELKLVLHISQELQEIIIELKTYIESLNLVDDQYSLSPHIKTLGINIGHLRKGLATQSSNIKLDNISKDFDKLHDTMLVIKSMLTE